MVLLCWTQKQNEMMLSDTDTYLKLKSNPTISFQTELQKLVSEGAHLGILSPRQAAYMVVKCPITAVFHSLPKIHKEFSSPLSPDCGRHRFA